MAVFALASIGCALAPAAGWLGAAIMLPNSLALLNHALAHDAQARRLVDGRGRGVHRRRPGAGRRARGPAGWPAIFWVNVPLCAAGLWLVRRLRETPIGHDRPPLDAAGRVLATLLLAALIAALIESRTRGADDALVAAGGVATDLFKGRDLRNAVFLGTVVNATYYGAIGVAAFGALAHGDAAQVTTGLRITCVVAMGLLAAAALAAVRPRGVPPHG